MAIDRKTYRRTKEIDFVGRRVKSLRVISNGLYWFPAGMTFTIKRKDGGFVLLSDPCSHCGIQAVVNKVEPQAVDFADQPNLWPGAAERI